MVVTQGVQRFKLMESHCVIDRHSKIEFGFAQNRSFPPSNDHNSFRYRLSPDGRARERGISLLRTRDPRDVSTLVGVSFARTFPTVHPTHGTGCVYGRRMRTGENNDHGNVAHHLIPTNTTEYHEYAYSIRVYVLL